MTNFVTNPGSGGSTFSSDTEGGVEVPGSKAWWGPAGSGSRADVATPLPIQPAATYFIFSAAGVNSTTTQLAASATFTGTIESIQSQQTISVLLTSDQPGTLHLIQYIDAGGTRVASDITENIAAGVPFSEAYTANGNYFKATFTNNGASPTTTFNLNVAYGTLPAVTSLGNSQVALNEVNGTNFTLGQKAMTASLPVVIASDQSGVTALDPMVTSTYNVAGVITINTVLLTMDCSTDAAVLVQCTSMGTSGVVTPEWSNDNATWVAATTLTTQAGASITTISAAGLWITQVCARYLRLRLSTATTAGTTTFSVQSAGNPTGASLPQTVVQSVGTAATRWFAQISDGTNSPAVKAASTAAAFTDPSLTVSVRPGEAMVGASAAMADALANPTLGPQSVLGSVFNGTTWDRTRGMGLASTTGDTGAKTATGNGATLTNVGNKGVVAVVNMGAVTGTSPTCTIKIQGSLDGGTTWYDIPGATTAALTATGVWSIAVYPGAPTVAGTTTSISGSASCGQPLPRTWRMVWTIGGTTPSFTITNIQYIYIPN